MGRGAIQHCDRLSLAATPFGIHTVILLAPLSFAVKESDRLGTEIGTAPRQPAARRRSRTTPAGCGSRSAWNRCTTRASSRARWSAVDAAVRPFSRPPLYLHESRMENTGGRCGGDASVSCVVARKGGVWRGARRDRRQHGRAQPRALMSSSHRPAYSIRASPHPITILLYVIQGGGRVALMSAPRRAAHLRPRGAVARPRRRAAGAGGGALWRARPAGAASLFSRDVIFTRPVYLLLINTKEIHRVVDGWR